MRPPKLDDFTKAVLEEYLFPGTDAAAVFVADGSTPSEEVKEVLGRYSQQRWYPVPGGHKAKVPFYCAKSHEALFEREPKGWDHEHCDFCEARIGIGELCWTASVGRGIIIFCKDCYAKVPAKRPWWRFWK